MGAEGEQRELFFYFFFFFYLSWNLAAVYFVFYATNMTDGGKDQVLLGFDGTFLNWPEGLALSLQEWLRNILLHFFKWVKGDTCNIVWYLKHTHTIVLMFSLNTFGTTILPLRVI